MKERRVGGFRDVPGASKSKQLKQSRAPAAQGSPPCRLLGVLSLEVAALRAVLSRLTPG